MERWNRATIIKAVVAALLAAALGFYASYTSSEELSTWLRVLPIIMAFASYLLVGAASHQYTRLSILRTLPEVNFPFDAAWVHLSLHLVLGLGIVAVPTILLLFPDTGMAHFVGSWPIMLFLSLVLLFILIGGNSLIVTKRKDERLYRDAVSSSFLSRQDYAYSLMGSYKDGLIISWKILPFDKMRSYEVEKKRLILRGREEVEEDVKEAEKSSEMAYALILYTPRLIKFVKPFLEKKRIPYR